MNYEQKLESILFSLLGEIIDLSCRLEPAHLEDQIKKYEYLQEEISFLNIKKRGTNKL